MTYEVQWQKVKEQYFFDSIGTVKGIIINVQAQFSIHLKRAGMKDTSNRGEFVFTLPESVEPPVLVTVFVFWSTETRSSTGSTRSEAGRVW